MSDAARRVLNALAEKILSSVQLTGLYQAKVTKDYGDNTVDVVPNSAFLPPLEKIPVLVPVAGMTLEVAVGTKVLVGFLEGSHLYPVVYSLCDGGSVKSLSFKDTGGRNFLRYNSANATMTVDTLSLVHPDGARAAARVGDIVTKLSIPVPGGTGPVEAWFIDDAGAVATAALTAAVTAAAAAAAAGGPLAVDAAAKAALATASAALTGVRGNAKVIQ